MALLWNIPYKIEDDEIIVSALDLKTIYTDKSSVEMDLTNQLNEKKIKVNWTELDEEKELLIVPNHKKVIELILELEPIERNPKQKSFDGKLVNPTSEEVIDYGY
jgi:hypothetical protein